jgi:hypothetical protein
MFPPGNGGRTCTQKRGGAAEAPPLHASNVTPDSQINA